MESLLWKGSLRKQVKFNRRIFQSCMHNEQHDYSPKQSYDYIWQSFENHSKLWDVYSYHCSGLHNNCYKIQFLWNASLETSYVILGIWYQMLWHANV